MNIEFQSAWSSFQFSFRQIQKKHMAHAGNFW